jgi:hypothetical protein
MAYKSKISDYEHVIDVLSKPKIMLQPWYPKDHEELGNGIYRSKIIYNNGVYNVQEDIVTPIIKLYDTTLEMMKSANNSKYVEDCLRIIIKEVNILLADALDMFNESNFKDEYKLKDKRDIYIREYKVWLSRYHGFLRDFISEDEFELYNSTVFIDWGFYSKRWAREHLGYRDDIILKEMNDLNHYPRIFTSEKSFMRFKELVLEFGNTKQNLANYSFVYHQMLYDALIYHDVQKLEFAYFLLEFGINIDRIKRLEDIGNVGFKTKIYSATK